MKWNAGTRTAGRLFPTDWRRTFVWLGAIVFSLLLAQPVAAAPFSNPDAPGWTAPVPMAPDDLPTLQSEPAIAMAGDHTLIGWTDSRNASPDLYTAWWGADQPGGETRATNLSPHFDTQRVFGVAVAVEASGRAFAVYSDGEQIHLVRYDPSTNRWSAPVQVTHGLNEWHAVARYPQLVTDGAGDLVIIWEDFRNADPNNNWSNSRGSDIYSTRCDGAAMTCPENNTKINSDATRGDQRRPRLSRRGNQVAAIWEDHRESGAEAPQVYAALSGDGGSTWGANMRVSISSTTPNRRDSATRPAIAYAADGSLFAVWEHRSGAVTMPADIFAARWNGSNWETPQRVDSAPPRTRSLAPSLAASDAGIFVAWQDHRHGASNPDIYAARWNGSGWDEVAVTSAPGLQIAPALATAGARVRIVWQDARQGAQDIYAAAWQGDSQAAASSGWSEVVKANSEVERSPNQMAPAIAAFGGVTYAVFLDNRKGYDELWMSRLPLGESRWTSPERLPTWARVGGDIATEGAQIAVDGTGQVHAVWSEYLWPYGRHILYSSYLAGRWRDPVRLSGATDDGRERFAPALAARNGVVAVVWSERDRQGTVQLTATWNSGNTWSTPLPVLAEPLVDWWILPSTVALSDSQVFVAWGEWRASGRGRIYVARRALQGGNWSYVQPSPTVNSDWCIQQHPRMQTDVAGHLHIVWSGCALRNPPDEWPHDSYVFYSVSSNGAESFGAPVRVGLTVAREDEEYHNDTSSRPALAVGQEGDVMVLYPGRVEGRWTFYAAMLKQGALISSQRIGDLATGWASAGQYNGRWYGGDSAGAIGYDAFLQRYLAIFPDRRNQRSPTLYATTYGGVEIDLSRQLYLPTVQR